MDDFFKEKQNESTITDYFNFNLDENKWIKILNHSILVHYEKHIKQIKEEIEKRKKNQIYNNNFNNANNTGNPQMMTAVNPMMIMTYQQMYLHNLNNLKNMPIQYNYPKQG